MLKVMMWWTLAAILLGGLCELSYSQSAVDGAIGGTVLDQSGAAVTNATVVIHSNSTKPIGIEVFNARRVIG
jgi:hypothetical protein